MLEPLNGGETHSEKKSAGSTSPDLVNSKSEQTAPHKKDLKSLLENSVSPEKPQEDRAKVDREKMAELWNNTTPADSSLPLPCGAYNAELEERKATITKSGNQACRLKFRVIEGQYDGSKLWKTIAVTRSSAAFAKMELSKVNTRFEQIDDPLTEAIRVKLLVGQQKGADGKTWNTVDILEQISVTPLGPDPFAPESADGTSGGAS